VADSPEHKFISQSLDRSLSDFSETKLLGIQEADRRTFDYGCMLLRDFSRPLISQVLWSHQEGIEKDIRTLLFEGGASLKLYFVRDNVRNRAKADEVLRSYRDEPKTSSLLRGFRLISVPDSFDADSESQRRWMDGFIRTCISNDLLFAVVFGKLSASDIAAFSGHGGPFGLKFAALDLITRSGLHHGPSFEKEVGSKGSPLREALTMLSATGLVGTVRRSILRVPTLKGRFLLDLSRRLMFEKLYCADWSDELRIIMRHLKIDLPTFGEESSFENSRDNIANEILLSMERCKSQFGRDLMAGISRRDSRFYSEFDWKRFTTDASFHIDQHFWEDADDLKLSHS
jgi:hypothetical protein